MTSFANASVLSRVCCWETVPTGMFAPSWPKPSVSCSSWMRSATVDGLPTMM